MTVDGRGVGFTVTATTLTLTDDEAVPEVTLALTPGAVPEAGGASAVTAALSGASSEAVTVAVSATGSTGAASTADYGAPAGFLLTIAANASSGTATFTITPTADGADEGGEVLSLLGRANALSVSGAVLGLADADRRGSLARLSVWPAAVREDAGATSVAVRAELDGAASADARALTVSVAAARARRRRARTTHRCRTSR